MKETEKPKWQLARAYIPYQEYTHRWQPLEGLKRGTIFPELFRPYTRLEHNGS